MNGVLVHVHDHGTLALVLAVDNLDWVTEVKVLDAITTLNMEVIVKTFNICRFQDDAITTQVEVLNNANGALQVTLHDTDLVLEVEGSI